MSSPTVAVIRLSRSSSDCSESSSWKTSASLRYDSTSGSSAASPAPRASRLAAGMFDGGFTVLTQGRRLRNRSSSGSTRSARRIGIDVGVAGRIVVGVDGSGEAAAALRWAVAEAKLRGAGVEAVHAWSYVPMTTAADSGLVPMAWTESAEMLEATQAAAARIAEEQVESVLGAGHAVAISLVQGDASRRCSRRRPGPTSSSSATAAGRAEGSLARLDVRPGRGPRALPRS